MNRADVVCPMHVTQPSPTCPTCQFLAGQPTFNRAEDVLFSLFIAFVLALAVLA